MCGSEKLQINIYFTEKVTHILIGFNTLYRSKYIYITESVYEAIL